MPEKRDHVTSECGVQYGRLRMGATRNRVAGKSNRQRPERLGSQGRLSEPDAKWLYQTLKGVGGWDRKNECQRLRMQWRMAGILYKYYLREIHHVK